ncbi:MAG: endolytic transglycosylase MltG [Rhodospirillaceae bacterium]|nr:MAG: endolytic transglycosylase MltG [Rhodospirillaceae bacterium]
MRFLRRLLPALMVVLIAATLGVGAALWFMGTVNGPGPLAASATVVIPPGAGLAAIARQLANADVVNASWIFELEARRSGQSRALKPGEYRFDAAVSLATVLSKIVRHDIVPRFVTIPEGLVTADVLRITATAEGLQGEVPGIEGEGELLPETYRYEWGDQRTAVIARMRSARNAMLTELWPGRATDLPLTTPEEAMVLASMVEKETALPAERPHIAAVFLNRLRRGMRLQSDPTVIYGLGEDGHSRELTRADLERETPFNTYVIDGLPPSPICNPGRASVEAVLHPDDSKDLYFVANGEGGHAFAATLEDHNRNVARWRRQGSKNVDEE